MRRLPPRIQAADQGRETTREQREPVPGERLPVERGGDGDRECGETDHPGDSLWLKGYVTVRGLHDPGVGAEAVLGLAPWRLAPREVLSGAGPATSACRSSPSSA